MSASVILGRDVPPKDRVEMECPGAMDFDFPIDDVRIAIDGVVQPPPPAVEVSFKNANAGVLTIVNRTKTTWPEGAAMTASWPDPIVLAMRQARRKLAG